MPFASFEKEHPLKRTLESDNAYQAAALQLQKRRLTRIEFQRELILKKSRFDILMNSILGYKIQDFHLAMYMAVEKSALEITNVPGQNQHWSLTLAPRGFGKSTTLTVGRLILKLLHDPNLRILIASKTDGNAVGFLSEIKQKLLRRELIEVFGEQQGFPWNDGNIRLKGRTSDAKEDTIQTVGIGGSLPSRHYDLIVCDDLIDENNSSTDGQREKVITWFLKVLLPCLEPHGELSIIGTRYNPDDLYGYLISTIFTDEATLQKEQVKRYTVFPALMPKQKVRANAPEVDHYTSLWPEKFSVDFLLKKRRQMGTVIFNSQYQNDVEAMKGRVFKEEWFQWYRLHDVNQGQWLFFQGVDLAIKQRDHADKFAHVTIAIDGATKNIYVRDFHNAVTPYSEQKRIIKEKFALFDPIRLAIEANGYQDALRQDMKQDSELASIRAVPIFTETDKYTRACKLSAFFERRQVFFLEGMQDLKEHLLLIPDGRYKDLFDALDIAVRTAFRGIRKVRDDEPGLL